MAFDRTKPEIDFPGDTPPSELVVDDQIVGDGAEAVAGSTVLTHYVGVAHSTGEEFDASWNRGEPLRFQLGVGQVIAGWDQGLQGMRVGGRRKITIPPHPTRPPAEVDHVLWVTRRLPRVATVGKRRVAVLT